MNELEEQYKKAQSYLIFKDSEAGKEYISRLKEECEYLVEKLCNHYPTSTHIELINDLSKLTEKRALMSEIEGAEDKVNILKEELKQYEKVK